MPKSNPVGFAVKDETTGLYFGGIEPIWVDEQSALILSKREALDHVKALRDMNVTAKAKPCKQ